MLLQQNRPVLNWLSATTMTYMIAIQWLYINDN